MVELVKNNIGLQVLTDTGYSEFDGLLIKGIRDTVILEIDDFKIACTPDHKIYVREDFAVPANELIAGDIVLTIAGPKSLTKITLGKEEAVYDLLNIAHNRRFYANDVLVSNCEFIIWDETLINPSMLVELAGLDPIERQGQVRWYKKPEPQYTYVVSLDPSLGTGGDPAGIQIFELPTFKQVGEWQHNRTPVQQQVGILAEILRYLNETVNQHNIYYSVENNTLGEAALISISEIGEENLKGIFLSEPKRPGSGRRYRKGFNTTNSTKISACAKLKNLIESKRMTIVSKPLISELKTFVANGPSYAAKPGETDDLVMALLLVVRMAMLLQSFDSQIDYNMKDSLEDIVEPMPFFIF
jgi:intein/homing endonuclease